MGNKEAAVQIVVAGEKGSGKSTVLHHIGLALKNAGFNVSATDDYRDTRRHFEVDGLFRPDGREIRISTSETSLSDAERDIESLKKMLGRLCSYQTRTSEEVEKDWDDARALLKRLRG